MAVDRLLPTQEATDLLALTRQLADRELAPRVEEHERTETYPDGLFATLGEAGLLGLPYPEELGGGGQPYEVYLQVLEELAARWAAVAVAVSVHGLVLLPARDVRHARAAGTLARPRARRRAGGRVLAVRAAGRLRRGRVDVQGGEDRRRLPHHRHEGVDHPRRRGRLLRALRPHRRGQPRRLVLPRAGTGRRPLLRQARGEDGPARDPDHHRPLGRRRTRRRPPDRRGGPGPPDRVRRPRLRPPRHRRRRHRARAVGPRHRRGLRPRAQHVRQADHRPPRPRVPARRHGRRRRLGPRHLPRRRPPPRRRDARTGGRRASRSSSPRTRP